MTKFFNFKSWGTYPPEYNREVHGPYNPTIYYGNDPPIGEVKVKDLVPWFSRRKLSPRGMCQLLSRAWLRYSVNWLYPKKPNVYCIFHMMAICLFFHWCSQYGYKKYFKNYKYH